MLERSLVLTSLKRKNNMLETVNRIYFKQSDYDSIDEMYEALFAQQLALVKNQYMCLTYKSPVNNNVYVLEFASLDPVFNQGKVLPCWITPDEARMIANTRLEDYQDNVSVEELIKDALKLDDNNDDGNNGGNNFDA